VIRYWDLKQRPDRLDRWPFSSLLADPRADVRAAVHEAIGRREKPAQDDRRAA
jgi:hypothetical protein